MDAKEYLSRIRRHNTEIDKLMVELAELKALATSTSAPMGGERVCASRNLHKLDDIIVKIAEKENMIDKEIDSLINQKMVAMVRISHIKSEKQRNVLEDYYIHGKRIKDIVKERGTSRQNIEKMQKKGLKELDKIIGNNFIDHNI